MIISISQISNLRPEKISDPLTQGLEPMSSWIQGLSSRYSTELSYASLEYPVAQKRE